MEYHKLEKVQLIIRSMLIGLITGIVVLAYRISLSKAVEFRNLITSNKLLILLFIIFSLLIQYMLYLAPYISGSGIPQVMALLNDKLKFNYILELPFKFISGVLAIFMGMSLGREGPSIHLGSLVSDAIIKIFNLPEKNERFLRTAGASAGLAAAFNAPLAASIFAVEELHKKFSPLLLITTIISSVTANLISIIYLGNKVSFVHFNHLNLMKADFKSWVVQLLILFITAFFMVFCADIFNYTLLKAQIIYKNIKLSAYIKFILVAMLSLLVVIYIPEISAGGHDLIENIAFNNNYTLAFLFFLFITKLLFTVICYSTGAAGGIFLPMLAIGSIIGKILGLSLVSLLGMEQHYIIYLILVSMAAYFTAVVKAPITGIVLVLEMTGNFSYLFSMVIAVSFTYILSEIFDKESIYEKLYKNLKIKQR